MYSQKEARCADLELGASGLKCKDFGCLSIDIVNALNLAGWNVTPEAFFERMNANNGFDADGLLQWYKVQELYPQFHYDKQTPGQLICFFVKGSWGVYKHWVLQVAGTYYEPYYGTNSLPAKWEELSRNRFASIDIKPIEAPTPPAAEPQPVQPTEQPQPAPEAAPVAPAPEVATHTVVVGDNLWNITKTHYNLSTNAEIAEKIKEVKAANPELERGQDFNLIYPGDVVKLP